MNCEQRAALSIFLILLETPNVSALLNKQKELDKYSLAACFAYFLRAGLRPESEYNEKNLALCLFIDNLVQVCTFAKLF